MFKGVAVVEKTLDGATGQNSLSKTKRVSKLNIKDLN